jgi:hypothetical protein
MHTWRRGAVVGDAVWQINNNRYASFRPLVARGQQEALRSILSFSRIRRNYSAFHVLPFIFHVGCFTILPFSFYALFFAQNAFSLVLKGRRRADDAPNNQAGATTLSGNGFRSQRPLHRRPP